MYVHAAARFKGKGPRKLPKEEAPMNTTTAAANQSTANTNKQQKQTAKEVIAVNVQALIEQLEQGHSDALTAYLTAMGRFHTYSFGNILEIARQRIVTYCYTSLGLNKHRGLRIAGYYQRNAERACTGMKPSARLQPFG
jgi:hypothetical protein